MNEYVLYNGELYHYGVKGMRWGRRRFQKTERKYYRAGKAKGSADYYRNKAEVEYKKHDRAATVLDKTANRLESQGKYFRAEAARKTAASLRQRGMNVKESTLKTADAYVRRSEKLNKKASEYATKKNVDIGKKRINSILESASKKGYERAKSVDEYVQEERTREILGNDGYHTYNKIRGK